MIVMNVFTGLAVGDVAAIQSTAQDIKWREIIKLILSVDETPKVTDRKATRLKMKIVPHGSFQVAFTSAMKKYFGTTNSMLGYSQLRFRSWVDRWEKWNDELQPIQNILESKMDEKFSNLEGKVQQLETRMKTSINGIEEKLVQLLELAKANPKLD